MESAKRFENYPAWIVFSSNLVLLSIYGIGLFIIFQIGYIYSLLFLVFILAQEYRVMRYHCINCYYWGKSCGFGKGLISSWFFKKGDASKFCRKDITWKDMIPDLLISLIPFIAGIVLLILKFDFILLTALLLLAALTSYGNGFIRGKLTCFYCKQRDLGCPAEKLFNKKK